MIFSVDIIEELEKIDPSLRSVLIKIFRGIEKTIGEVVKREDFIELKNEVTNLTKTIKELAEVQKQSEERLSRLEQVVEELAEAQKKTEEALNELAEAQKQSEERLTRVEKAIEELTEAQKKSEERLNRVEKAIEELAEAQKKTEEALNKLTEEHRKTRENLGGLAHTVGYFLENEAYKYLPMLLKRDFNIEVEGELIRDYVEVSPYNFEEINIIGKGKIDGKEVVILGEAKTQLKKTDIDKFLVKVKKLDKIYPSDKILICVTHQAHPAVRIYAKQKDVKIYYSYQFK